MDGVIMLFLEEIHFERKDGEKFVHIALDVLYSVFFPRPYFGRDIVEHGNLRILVDKLRNVEIEPWIIHEDKHIGIVFHNILLADGHITEYRPQVEQYRNKAHVCKFSVMFHPRAAHGRHKIAAEEAEVSLGIPLLQRLHKMGGMKVAARLPGNYIVFHSFFTNQLSTTAVRDSPSSNPRLS